MKHYLVKLDIQAGGFEKNSIHLVEAVTRDMAALKALEDEAHDDISYDDICEYWEDGCGEFAYRVDSVRIVEDEDVATMKKYLHGYHAGI